MGGGVMDGLKRLLRDRKIQKIEADRDLVLKEIKGAGQDLASARGSIKAKNFKWATVQAYYSMFHPARALLYSKGYREKSNRGLLLALKELTGDMDEVTPDLLRTFGEAMDLREEADYGLEFSKDNAGGLIHDADAFLKTIRRVLGVRRRA
jgi:uncharacterized protein (UPF0332 family)